MSYAKHIELTRVQLHRSVNRQNLRYGIAHRPSKEEMAIKLIRYCTRVNGNLIFAGLRDFSETDLNVGWAGKKRKQQMRDTQSVTRGRKAPKVVRKSYSNPLYFRALVHRMLSEGIVPAEPLERVESSYVASVLFIRNHRKGELHVLNQTGTVKVIPWIKADNVTVDSFYEAWSGIQVDMFGRLSVPSFTFKPLFKKPRLQRRLESTVTGL